MSTILSLFLGKANVSSLSHHHHRCSLADFVRFQRLIISKALFLAVRMGMLGLITTSHHHLIIRNTRHHLSRMGTCIMLSDLMDPTRLPMSPRSVDMMP
jgi:hypothetical protein